MRLLSKSDIDKQKALERQRDVEEGLKLARKLDQLRSLLPQEEAALQSYREKTLEAIHADITAKQSVLTTLLQEVAVAEARRADAIQGMAKDIENAKTLMQQAAEMSIQARNDATKAKNDLEVATVQREKTEKNLVDAEIMYDRAQKELSTALRRHEYAMREYDEARKERLEVLEMRITTENALAEREKCVAEAENRTTMLEDTLLRREDELRKQERKLADREALLERNLRRIKK